MHGPMNIKKYYIRMTNLYVGSILGMFLVTEKQRESVAECQQNKLGLSIVKPTRCPLCGCLLASSHRTCMIYTWCCMYSL